MSATPPQASLARRLAGTAPLVLLSFFILRKLVSVRKLALEAEVKASSPDAAGGDDGEFLNLTTFSTFLAVFDGMCLGFILCQLLGDSIRKYTLGFLPTMGFLGYQTYHSVRLLALVNMSYRCTWRYDVEWDGTDASTMVSTLVDTYCPMSLTWDYLETFHRLPDKYVKDLIFVTVFQVIFFVFIPVINIGGEWATRRYLMPAVKVESYEAVESSEKVDVSEA